MNDDVVFDGKIAELNRISSKGAGPVGPEDSKSCHWGILKEVLVKTEMLITPTSTSDRDSLY